jgi:hypothetical protein
MKPPFADVERERWPRLIVCEVLEAVEELEIGRLLRDNGYELAGRGRLNGIFRLRP